MKSERQKVNRKALGQRWWQYAEKRPGMRKAIAGLDEVLAITLHSRSVMPVRVPTNQVFSHALGVSQRQDTSTKRCCPRPCTNSGRSPTDPPSRPGSATHPRTSSRPSHGPPPPPISTGWAVCSTRNVARSCCGGVWASPSSTTSLTTLRDLQCQRHRRRPDARDPRRARSRGPRCLRLERPPLDHGFHTYRQMTRWTVSPAARVELLDRLLEENHRRAARHGSQPPALDTDAATDADEIGEDHLDRNDGVDGEGAAAGRRD